MRRIHRAASIVLLLTMATGLAACADGFDPDKLDILGLNEKKKLPGKREALFPGGVPGVTQGIPPEYLKGNVAEQPGAAVPIEPLKPEAQPPAQTASAEPAAAAEKPKPRPVRKHVAAKLKPKPKPTRVTLKPAPVQPAQQAASPWPAAPPPPPQQQPAQQASSPWPDQQQQTPAPWPSAPPPGTFTKQ